MLKLAGCAAVLIAGAGCNEEQCRPTAWLMGGTGDDSVDNDIVGRVGLRNPQGIEFGAESNWIGVHGANQNYGAYVIGELDKTPVGTPYIGGHASIIDDEDGGFYGPVAGTILEVAGIETVIEYQYLEFTGMMEDAQGVWNDEHKVLVGFRLRF